MIRFLADENFNARIVRGVRRQARDIDILTAYEARLGRTPDAQLLAWAAEQHRAILTHDIKTLVGRAYERVKLGQPMAGVVAVGSRLGIGVAIADLALIGLCMEPEEMEGRGWFLPL